MTIPFIDQYQRQIHVSLSSPFEDDISPVDRGLPDEPFGAIVIYDGYERSLIKHDILRSLPRAIFYAAITTVICLIGIHFGIVHGRGVALTYVMEVFVFLMSMARGMDNSSEKNFFGEHPARMLALDDFPRVHDSVHVHIDRVIEQICSMPLPLVDRLLEMADLLAEIRTSQSSEDVKDEQIARVRGEIAVIFDDAKTIASESRAMIEKSKFAANEIITERVDGALDR